MRILSIFEHCVARLSIEAWIGKPMCLCCAESGLNVTVWSVPRLQSQLQLPLQVRSGGHAHLIDISHRHLQRL